MGFPESYVASSSRLGACRKAGDMIVPSIDLIPRVATFAHLEILDV